MTDRGSPSLVMAFFPEQIILSEAHMETSLRNQASKRAAELHVRCLENETATVVVAGFMCNSS